MLSLFTYAHSIIKIHVVLMNHLIILPCHSVWSGGPSKGEQRDEWHLAPFQYEGNDHLCFIDHVSKSIKELKNDPHAVLVISGGQTQKDAGPQSEAYSYYQLAKALYGDDPVFDRICLEEFARDSFENVIFLICRFFEIKETYPERISVVGFQFKHERFVNHHLQEALQFPVEKVNYIGNSPNPEFDDSKRARYFADLMASEKKHALSHFQKDWYGISHPLLDKKKQRNPFKRTHGYYASNKQLQRLLEHISDEGSDLESIEIRSLVNFPWTQK